MTTPMLLTLFCFGFFSISTCGSNNKYSENPSKRILLTDPDVMGSRLANLEAAVQQLKTENEDLRTKMTRLTTNNEELRTKLLHFTPNNERGSTYTQWGRKDCTSPDSETIYSEHPYFRNPCPPQIEDALTALRKGFVAGNLYNHDPTHYGGPANFLCLPNNPQRSNQTLNDGSYIYGTEFFTDKFISGAAHEDVPCAVCRTINATSSLMVPGRMSCYTGWKSQYIGYLASGHYTQTASSYICVDRNPEYVQGGKADLRGRLLYKTTTSCGSLPCPPYDSNEAVLCVLCTK